MVRNIELTDQNQVTVVHFTGESSDLEFCLVFN